MKIEAEYSPAPGFDAPDPAELNNLLPGYEVTDLLARGSMGAVYYAHQVALQREVAIKVLPRELSQLDEFEQSFKAEARAMAALPHPHLISVYDFGEVDGMLYLVMEYIEGESLSDAAHGQMVDPVQSVQIVQRVADGLGYAHEHGLLHRDIKPPNILISLKAEPKLGDFGLVVPSNDVGSGMMMGTPGYLAPEMLRDFNAASPASDVFALGVILHELLTGVEPDGENPVDLDLVPGLRGLRELVQNATARNVLMRYRDGKRLCEGPAGLAGGGREVSSAGPGRGLPRGDRFPARSRRVAPVPGLAPSRAPAAPARARSSRSSSGWSSSSSWS